MPDTRRVPALDGLRGLAVLLVLGVHASQPLGWDAATPLGAGWLGVDLFFVLSGYLITGILLATRERPGYFRVFYARRVLRIFPLYYLTLGAALLAGTLAGREWWYALYLANVSVVRDGWPHAPIQVVWSLAVEEQFYLVWPLVVLLVRPRRALLGVCLLLLLAAPFLRVWLIVQGLPVGAYVLAPARMDGLAAGALLALLAQRPGGLARIAPVARLLLPLAGCSLLGVLRIAGTAYSPPLTQAVGYSLAALTFACLLSLTVTARSSPFAWGPLRWCGTISYALYLWHVPSLLLGVQLLGPALGVPLGLALAVGAAWLSGRYLEGPILALKRFVPYGGAAPASVRLRQVCLDQSNRLAEDAGQVQDRAPGLRRRVIAAVGHDVV